ILYRGLELRRATRKFSRAGPVLAADFSGHAYSGGVVTGQWHRTKGGNPFLNRPRSVDRTLCADNLSAKRSGGERGENRFRPAGGNHFCGLAGSRAVLPEMAWSNFFGSVRRNAVAAEICSGDLTTIAAVSATTASTAASEEAAHIHRLATLQSFNRRSERLRNCLIVRVLRRYGLQIGDALADDLRVVQIIAAAAKAASQLGNGKNLHAVFHVGIVQRLGEQLIRLRILPDVIEDIATESAFVELIGERGIIVSGVKRGDRLVFEHS